MQNDNFSFRAIHQPSVVEQIIETFKQAIMRGELRPGHRLPSEQELSQQLGVGRSAVREAMKILEALGVVIIQQGSGTIIADKPSSKLLNPLMFAIILEAGLSREFYELRYTVQVGYCELAAQNATAADWERLEHANISLESCLQKSESNIEAGSVSEMDLAFHYAILDATHNPYIIKIGRTVEEMFFNSIYATISNTNLILKRHQTLLDALRNGDAAHIRETVTASLKYWKDEIEKQTSDIG